MEKGLGVLGRRRSGDISDACDSTYSRISPVCFEIRAKSFHLLECVSSPGVSHSLHRVLININIHRH